MSKLIQYRDLNGVLRDLITVYNGKDAYEIAVEQGFNGTRDEWLASLAVPAEQVVGIGTEDDIPENTDDRTQLFIRTDIDEESVINKIVDNRIKTILKTYGLNSGTNTTSTSDIYKLRLALPPVRTDSADKAFTIASINVNSTDVIFANIDIYSMGENGEYTSYGKYLVTASKSSRVIGAVMQYAGKENMLCVKYDAKTGSIIIFTQNSAWDVGAKIFVKAEIEFSSTKENLTITINDKCVTRNVANVNTSEMYEKYWIANTVNDTDCTNPIINDNSVTNITYTERTE